MTALSREEIQRYSRHLILEEVGMKGQEKLKDSAVLCVGTGGLGSPLLLYLAAAGVGRIGIVDFDVVDESNLQRQIIHGTSTVGHKKVLSAKERILTLIHTSGSIFTKKRSPATMHLSSSSHTMSSSMGQTISQRVI